MTEPTSNDNHDARQQPPLREPDAHGQAAMLLVECLSHGLVARSLITVANAIEMVEVALDVKEVIADDLGELPATKRASRAILGSIRLSLTNDAPAEQRSS